MGWKACILLKFCISFNNAFPVSDVALICFYFLARMITDLYGCTNYSSQLFSDNRRSADGRRRSAEELLATERIEVVKWSNRSTTRTYRMSSKKCTHSFPNKIEKYIHTTLYLTRKTKLCTSRIKM